MIFLYLYYTLVFALIAAAVIAFCIFLEQLVEVLISHENTINFRKSVFVLVGWLLLAVLMCFCGDGAYHRLPEVKALTYLKYNSGNEYLNINERCPLTDTTYQCKLDRMEFVVDSIESHRMVLADTNAIKELQNYKDILK